MDDCALSSPTAEWPSSCPVVLEQVAAKPTHSKIEEMVQVVVQARAAAPCSSNHPVPSNSGFSKPFSTAVDEGDAKHEKHVLTADAFPAVKALPVADVPPSSPSQYQRDLILFFT
ncbi:hypothetical protein HPP92_026654 [Vanilla planifolia]|uniref:Uncharacterized protein n=1 Tax=Vanilla planifolia TaxID=51239 RepID=A0A835PBH3_VANPL|nr:hypothetical protein HPP92_026654 [Vanilla planifolia]